VRHGRPAPGSGSKQHEHQHERLDRVLKACAEGFI